MSLFTGSIASFLPPNDCLIRCPFLRIRSERTPFQTQQELWHNIPPPACHPLSGERTKQGLNPRPPPTHKQQSHTGADDLVFVVTLFQSFQHPTRQWILHLGRWNTNIAAIQVNMPQTVVLTMVELQGDKARFKSPVFNEQECLGAIWQINANLITAHSTGQQQVIHLRPQLSLLCCPGHDAFCPFRATGKIEIMANITHCCLGPWALWWFGVSPFLLCSESEGNTRK